MQSNYLSYWKPRTADHQLKVGGRIGHIASNQYGKVQKGDVVWLVTIRSGNLYLIGRVQVGKVTDQREASELLGTTDIWESSVHILAAEGTDKPISNILITLIAPDLRFISPTGRDRLTIKDGFIEAGQIQSMRLMTEKSSILLHAVLFETLPKLIPEEVESGRTLVEGAVQRISVNAYERDREARNICMAHHGTDCCVCGFSFGRFYGESAEGFIHVHHLRPLSEIGKAYVVDPVTDLRPVCPNCHAVIHQGSCTLTIGEAKALIKPP